MSTDVTGLHIAPFSMDGASMGRGYWNEDQLSEDVFSLCKDLVINNESVFRKKLEGPLAHIELHFTSSGRCGIATFYVNGQTALSALCLSEHSTSAEQITGMFVQSARRMSEKMVGTNEGIDGFNEIVSIDGRPLLVVIPWSSEAISDDDFAITREICIHFASAFFASTGR